MWIFDGQTAAFPARIELGTLLSLAKKVQRMLVFFSKTSGSELSTSSLPKLCHFVLGRINK